MTTTTNYAWTKPTVGGDSGSWGTELNADLDGIDATVFAVSGVANAALPKAGGTLSGALTLAAGASGVGDAPAYFQAGALLASPAAHALEWDGTSLYVTQATGPARKTLVFSDGSITGSAGRLATAHAISASGDASWTVSFDGSADASAALTIAAGAVTAAKMASGAAAANLGFAPLAPANSLSDVANAAAARGNLGLKSYRTADYTPSLASAVSEAHGLGTLPSVFSVGVYMRNTGAEGGYAVGDIVALANFGDTSGARGVAAWVNDTNVGFAVGAVALTIVRKDTGGEFNATASNWKAFAILRLN